MAESRYKALQQENLMLQSELQKLRKELESTAIERDHLREHAFHDHRGDRARLLRAISRNSQRAPASSFETESGYSSAPLTSDPRIGRPKRMLVVGGGPAGLVALHELLNPFNRPKGTSLADYHIELYERRPEVGGVWFFEDDNSALKGWSEADASAKSRPTLPPPALTLEDELLYSLERKNSRGVGAADYENLSDSGYDGSATVSPANGRAWSQSHTSPCWPTPAYEGLVGNVLPPLLAYSAMKFPPPHDGLFPSMVETHQYLLDFAAPMRSRIRTNREVSSIRPVYHAGKTTPSWKVVSRDWTDNGLFAEEMFDAVLVCPGAFDRPYWPAVPGLGELRASGSHLIMHAKTYPGPRPFVGKRNKIVVVGNANSANDIAAHLAPLCDGPLYRCIRHESNFAHLPDRRIQDVAPIASVHAGDAPNTLTVVLEDGRRIESITKLIFATGYEYDYPWLTVPRPDGSLGAPTLHGAVPDMHLATLHACAPTLGIIGLSVTSSPIPLAECTARLAARAFYGLLRLPERLGQHSADRVAELGLERQNPDRWRLLHYLRGAPERVLQDAVLQALEDSEPGASAGLFRWDEEREELLERMRSIKEGELRRIRDAQVAAGGVDGGVGGVLATACRV